MKEGTIFFSDHKIKGDLKQLANNQFEVTQSINRRDISRAFKSWKGPVIGGSFEGPIYVLLMQL